MHLFSYSSGGPKLKWVLLSYNQGVSRAVSVWRLWEGLFPGLSQLLEPLHSLAHSPFVYLQSQQCSILKDLSDSDPFRLPLHFETRVIMLGPSA